jgi:hypothetical protein
MLRNFSRRNLILFLASLIFVSTLGDSAEARRRRKKRVRGKIIVNQILKLEGTITNNGNPAMEFSEIKQGDVLETGESSYAVVRVPGLGLFRMGPKTRLKMTSFMDRNNTKIEMTGGEVLALYRRLGEHQFVTPNGIISPRAATFQVLNRTGEKNEILCHCDGRLDFPEIESSPGMQAPSTGLDAPAKAALVVQIEAQLSAESGGKIPAAHPLQIVSEWAHKPYELSPKKLEPREDASPRAHSENLIQDLESLYALP